ncbi:acetyl-CoA synthetase-like protein [Wallemia mellicola]|uniref:Acetyl-CoA synthetase-like protein n=1 Tax=Wallemia mellicola TaxID=1708541 RepID=A0AB38MPH9_9BASI|nr:hypothetical protein E3Q24_03035 [Wallemia mellicola]TIB88378.1 acetyl-CoA synthetase-like protein [Wallemia mellicola]TIB91185.1 acetyl-CoA synthetase-like protein [Wallemia mellicola]TIC40646.1 acetyl-CoA synthetase-like protein [Wallemia mellicola]TIC47131.1 acetyl-CoA synthetase-like protein [Wallemia mellicola]
MQQLTRFIELLKNYLGDDEFSFEHNGKTISVVDGSYQESAFSQQDFQLHEDYESDSSDYIYRIKIINGEITVQHKLPQTLADTLRKSFTGEEDNQPLSSLNHPPQSAPSDKLLHSDFLAQVQSNGDSVAVDFNGSTLTYTELDNVSNALALEITSKKLFVPLLLPPSLELYVGYLAALKSGNAFSPFDLQAPIERHLGLLEDLSAEVVLGLGPREEWIPASVNYIDVTTFIDTQKDSTSKLTYQASPDDVAYVLFTSGSTGKPKGVQIQHSAAAASIQSHLAVRPLDNTVRWFQFAPSTFDPSIMETFMSFSSGSTICAAPRAEFLTNPELVISNLRCTHMMATPSIAGLFNPDKLPKGFELWTMGEKLSDRVISNFTRPGNELYNAYGPTEAAINVTLRRHPSTESGARLGPPIKTASLLIFHPTLNKIMPMGFTGELVIGGPQLAKGYLNMPEQTDKVFIDVEGLGRLYRTGDKARVVLDENNEWNNIEYLGRIGLEQVKLNGKRVELGEIDTVLSNTEGVRSVHTVVNQPEGQLCAFVTPNSKDLIDKCTDSAEKQLPSHMRPVVYFTAEDVPRSTAGKADRKAISRYLKDHISEGHFVGAAEEEQSGEIIEILDTPTLDKVVDCVSKTVDLNKEEIDVNLTLLALGIDSLRGVRFLSLAREAGLTGITIEDVIKGFSPAVLSNIAFKRMEDGFADDDSKKVAYTNIESEFRGQAIPAVVEALGFEPEIIRPATTMQTGLLALYSKTGTGYINHSVYTLKENIDDNKLEKAWYELVKRHEILRTRFVLVDNSPISAFAQVVVDIDPSSTFDKVEGNDTNALVQSHIENASSKFSLLERTQTAALYSDSKSKKLVVSLHHALFDGASLALMLDELAALYNNPQADIHREKFVNALTDVFTADAKANNDYWSGKLQNFTPDPFPDLTGLRQDAKKDGHHVTNVTSKLSYTSFLEKARSLRMSPLSVVQAAWSSILLAYSESDANDVVFGSIVGGRTTDVLEHTVGPVFTAAPIRVTNPDDESLSAVLQSLVNSNADGMVHRHLPPKVLSGDNGIIYDTTIALQQFAQGASQTDLWSHSEYPPMVTEFAVVLEIWPDPNDTIRLRATCSNNVLIEESSKMMLTQFDDILSSILNGDLKRKFKDVAVDVNQSLKSAVNENPVRVEGVEKELIHSQFERNAQENPESLALWFKPNPADSTQDIKWTYKELDARANKIANYLTSTYGDLTDVPIPIHIEKTPEMFMAILGIVKAGGAWCPIDTTAPALRKKDLFERAGGPVVLVRDDENKALVSDIIEGKIDVRSFTEDVFNNQPSTKPEINTQSKHLAYLIWTSGTTGAPKGVPIEHSAAVQSLTVLQEEIPWKKNTHIRCLNFSAYTFDVSVLDVFYAWGKTRGTLCSSTRDNLVGSFEELVRGFEATHAFLTPAFMAQSSLQNCDSLESLISIGEKLPQPVADAWCKEGTVSLNTYGPAESTIIATYRRFTPNEITKAHNVGLPLSTISCYVVSDDRVLLRGAVGELALGGFQNARGYHRNPEQTNKKFINHPQAGNVYLTGDVVRLLHDGSCEFVGRNDDLVKLGGIRVELSEISAALGNCHEIARETTTFQLTRHDRPQKVVCTFVAAPALKGDEEDGLRTDDAALEVAAACKERAESSLPAYMIPNVILVLTHLPHTPSNKIDRKMLAKYYEDVDIANWESRLSGIDDGDDGSWNEMEQTIREVVAKLTNVTVESISKSSHLPALGVDSIRSLQLASKLRNAGVNAAVSQIAAFPTIKQLAKAIARATSNQTTTDTPKWLQDFNDAVIEKVRDDVKDVEFVLPCTPTQEGMLSETIKDPATYWSHHVFKLADNVDISALFNAWNAVANRTQALRTSFVPAATYGLKESVFLQCIKASPKLLVEEVQYNEDKILEERVRNIVNSWSSSNRPPVALTLATKTDGSRYLMTSLHHAIYDGDSLSFIYQDVEAAYKQVDVVKRTSLKSAMAFMNADSNKTKEFWTKVLEPFAESSNAEWPVLHNDKAQHSLRFWTKGFSDVKRPQINQLLQAAWAVLQSRYTSTTDVIFGETLSLRGLAEGLDSAVAPLIATLPVAVRVDENATAKQLIERLSQLAAESAPHRFVGLQHVRQALKYASGAPLFPALFVLIVESGETVEEDLFKDRFEIGELDVEHPIAINAFVRGDSVQVDILGSNSMMSESQVQLIANQMQALVNSMSDNADLPVSQLLSKIDDKLLAKSYDSDVTKSNNALVALSQNALERPDDIAVRSDEGTLSFKQLEEQSNKIANSLSSKKVVGLCIPPSLESIAHRIGLFKSGKTYLAIGENLPANRKRLIARSLNADIVYTTKKFAEDFKLLGSDKVVIVDSEGYISELTKASSERPTLQETESAAITFANGQLDTHDYTVWSSTQLFENISVFAEHLKTSSSTSTFLNWLPGTFGLHILETFAPLVLGSTILCKRVESLQDNPRNVLKVSQVTHAILTAAWFEKECIVRSELPQLEHIVLAGHISSKALHESWKEANVWKTFAIAKSSLASFLTRYDIDQPHQIGKPLVSACIANTDASFGLRGEAGELCAFDSAGKLIHSGTVARMLDNDNVLFEHKASDVVDYRGSNINLEQVSRNVEGVSLQNVVCQSLVIQHPESMQPDIITFVARAYTSDPLDGTPAEINAQDESFARALVQSSTEKLQYGARPDIVLPMTFLPISDVIGGRTNHKVLRRLFSQVPLRNMVQKTSQDVTTTQRPLSEEEKTIAVALSEQTGVSVDTITPSTTTLELGVDSLSAISLSFHLKSKGVSVPPHIVLSGPSVEKLARLAGSPSESGKDTSAVRKLDKEFENNVREVFGDSVDAIRPCLPLQEGLVARTLNSTEPVYVNHFTFKLSSEVNVDQFVAATSDTIAANDIFRTCFYFGQSAVAQVALKEVDIIQRSQNVSEEASLAALQTKKVELERNIVDNIQSVAPVRVTVEEAQNKTTFVQFTMHHAVYDGETLPMFLEEIKQRYENRFSLERPSVDRLLDYISSQSLEIARTFFVEYLADLPQSGEIHIGNTSVDEISKTATLPLSKLELLARSMNVSLRVLVQTAYGVSLGETNGVSDITTGVVLSGRTVPVTGVESMLAPCITTLPVRVKVSDKTRFADLAQQAQGDSAQVLEYQYTPLRHIQKWLNRPSALFNSLFAYNKSSASGEQLWEQLEESSRVDYPLALEATANTDKDELVLRVVYSSSFGHARDVDHLLGRIDELLQDAQQVVEPLIPIDLTVDDGEKYDNEWSDAETLMRKSIAELCKLDEKTITKDSTFISLGIDSISSVRFAQALRKQGVDVPTSAIMRAGCIGALSAFVGGDQSDVTGEFDRIANALFNKYGREDIQVVLPATALQSGMLTQTIASQGKYYNIHHTLRLDDGVNLARLHQVVEATAQEVDILRTTFQTDDEYAWVMLVHKSVKVPWSEHTVDSAEDAAKLVAEVNVPRGEADFECPPYAFMVINTSEGTYVNMTMHHALYDGVSLPLLLGDIEKRYRGEIPARRPQFVQAAPYILDGARDTQGYWQKQMEGYVPKSLPRIDGVKASAHFANTTVGLTAKMTRIVRAAGVSLQSLVLLAWGKTLSTLLGSLDIAFGQVVAGRSIPIEDALLASGPLFKFRLKKDMTNAQALHAQYAQYNDMEAHSHVPLRDIQRNARQRTLFESLFVFQKPFNGAQEDTFWKPAELTRDETQSVEYPLNAEFVDGGDSLSIHASCAASVMTGEELDGLLAKFAEVLADIVDHPQESCVGFPSTLGGLGDEKVDAQISYVEHNFEGPITRTMETVRAVFADIAKLPVEEISYGTPLYALGLDSVGAIQLASRCRKMGVKDLGVSDIFVGESIAGLDEVLSSRVKEVKEDSKPLVSATEAVNAMSNLHLRKDDVQAVLPLLPGQHYHLQAWLLSGHTFYEPVFAYEAPVRVNNIKMADAWRRLVKQHDVLRTAFTVVNGRPLQVLLKEHDAAFETHYCEDAESFIKDTIRKEFNRPSTLATPPVKLHLVQSDEKSYVLLRVHHALYDAWSIPILAADLWSCYKGRKSDSVGGFKNIVESLAKNGCNDEFWKEDLKDSQPALLPRVRESTEQVFFHDPAVVESASEATSGLQSHQVSLQAVCTTAVGRVVSEMSGVAHPIVGVYHTGRAATVEGIDRVSGPCLNLLPLSVAPGDTIAAAREVQRDIARRTIVEQDHLGAIAKVVFNDGVPLFNVYVNILWHAEKIFSLNDSSLMQMDVGAPTDFVSKDRIDVRSSVRELSTAGVSQDAVFLDIALDAQKDTVGVAARASESVMSSAELQAFIGKITTEIKSVI